MKKTILLLLFAVLAFPALPHEASAQLGDGDGGAWRQIMSSKPLLAGLNAGDTLYVSDRGWGKMHDISYRQIDSVALALRATDSLGRSRLIIERPGVNGHRDTVGLELDSIASDVGGWLVVSWFQLNKALGGLGLVPPYIDFHLMLRSQGTTYAGVPQVAAETFDMWLKEYRKE
jgi:hypothetical protein